MSGRSHPELAKEIAREFGSGVRRAVLEFDEAMQAVKSGQGGRLSVGVVSTAKYFAPRLIAAFVNLHPRLELRFRIGNRDETLGALKSRDVEIALAGRNGRAFSPRTASSRSSTAASLAKMTCGPTS